MESLAEKALGRLLLLLGLKITRAGKVILGRTRHFGSSGTDKFKWVREMNIKTVIDVGAHEGESALEFHKFFPDAKIYCFEPLSDCFVRLNNNTRNVTNFRSFNLALGDAKDILTMHRSEFSASSSLLKMAELHKKAFPYSSGESLETVEVDTLDNIAQELELEDNILLKIDVQGYEYKVIIGSQVILKRVKIIIIETSFQELYEGQPQFSTIYKLLHEQGFVYSGSWGELRNPLNGAPLQQDSIFIKR
jgi:FkbM family methyltransferase